MKLRITIAILILLFSFTYSYALVNRDKIVKDIAQSINDEPENWIDTGSRMVYAEDKVKVKQLKKLSWPEHEADVSLYYNFYSTFNYAKLDKPFEYDFTGDSLKKLLKAIKYYKYKRLNKEFYNYKVKSTKPKPMAKEEQTIKEENYKMKKLN